MPKVDICALDQECVQKFQHYIEHRCFPPHKKQRNKPYFRSLVFFLSNILPVLHPLTCLSWFCFVCVHMNGLVSGILIPFSKIVALSRIARLLFTIASTSSCSISITICCASAIVCTSMVCYTFNCTSMDSCFSFAIMFSSFASFCTICASTKCCSSTSSSFSSSMHTGSTNVAPSPICSLAHQRHLLLHKNSNADVLVIFMF